MDHIRRMYVESQVSILSGQSSPRRQRYRAPLALLLAILVLRVVGAEVRTSRLQAFSFAWIAQSLDYTVEPGVSSAIRFPHTGPYDRRLGYTSIPDFARRLTARGYAIEAQVHSSLLILRLVDWGFPALYRDKAHAGLRIKDWRGAVLYDATRPVHVYPDFRSIPRLVVNTLLFIENRELLAPGTPHRNPAVEWDRLAVALGANLFGIGQPTLRSPGGSTLATQIEKYRHEPGDRTHSVLAKLRQMIAATLRSYLDGPETLAARRRVVVDYVNTVPFAAVPGKGEIFGLGDALGAWFGADFDAVNAAVVEAREGAANADTGRAYRQVLSLLLALRRPSHYLLHDRPGLERLTDGYLRLLVEAGVVDRALYDAALDANLAGPSRTAPPPPSFAASKGVRSVRRELLGVLGEDGLYELDRLDLSVATTLDSEVQRRVAAALQAFRTRKAAAAAGLRERRLLGMSDPRDVVYSLTLLERGDGVNRLRVHADSLDQPFDVTNGMKLDLGSTAKLRTLVHYLEIVADLHDTYSGRSEAAMGAVALHPPDPISRFVVDRLRSEPGLSLADLLDAALERRYSANPHERFFTGDTFHRFGNFDHRFDARVLSLREAFRDSVNLPFVRLMRDIVNHVLYGPSGLAVDLSQSPADPRRRRYLERFIELEATRRLEGFVSAHIARSPGERLQALVSKGPIAPGRLALLFRSVAPDSTAAELTGSLERALPDDGLEGAALQELYDRSAPSIEGLASRAFRAGVDPLELWLVGYLRVHPDAARDEILTAAAPARREAYEWLFKTRIRAARDRRVAIMLEHDAFETIQRARSRLGYPFGHLVPSLATAIGASSDRPSALADLLGVIVSGGEWLPTRTIEELRFASGTPYETVLRPAPERPRSLLRREVTAVVREVLFEVVDRGTARRLRRGFDDIADPAPRVGGKTGTGDNRFKRFGSRGQLLSSRVTSRTAAFAFLIDDRFYGVVTAHVAGERAADHAFTSSLPVQVLKALAPTLAPLIRGDGTRPSPAPGRSTTVRSKASNSMTTNVWGARGEREVARRCVTS